jgi:Carbohydrate esterase, sialic acid-specific acetylesterase
MDASTILSLVIVFLLLVAGICGGLSAYWFARRLKRALQLQSNQIAAVARAFDQQNKSLLELVDTVTAIYNQRLFSSPDQQGGPGFLGRLGKPSDILLDARDTYERLDQNWLSIHGVGDRQETSISIDGDRNRTAVIAILGQSNAGNHGAGRYEAKYRVDNFNIYDGRCYRAVDPLLGASGDGGNFATRLGDKLIDCRMFDRVILAPIAMGGTTVEQWAEEGMFNRRIPVLIRRLYDAGLSIDFILWHQGEGNNGIGDANGRQYRKNLMEVIRTFRMYGVDAPFFVGLTTLCNGWHANPENIRAGQKGAVNPRLGIHLGADTDVIGVEDRWDTCHFSEHGLELAASLWFKVIADFKNSNRQWTTSG